MEKWFDWHDASFLICTPSMKFILELNRGIMDGELDKEDAMRSIFESCLKNWTAIGHEGYPRHAIVAAIWGHAEARTFIIDCIEGLLNLEVDSKVVSVERTLLNRGQLKN